MIRLDRKIVVSLIVLALGGAGYWGWHQYHAEHAAAASPAAPNKTSDTLHFEANAPQLSFIEIKTVEAFPEPLVEPLNARIAYDDNHTARVFSPVAGRVVKILAETGKRVEKGEGVLVLDAPDYAQAVADSSKAEADLLRKKEIFERAKQLYEARGLARKDMESADADRQQAEAEAIRAKARLANLNGSPGRHAGQYVLTAPHAGTISERQVSAGSEVRPDAPNPLFVITDTSQVWVLVDLPEQDIGKVKAGQSVLVQVDAYPNESFLGKITVIGGSLDPVTRRIQVRCQLNNPQARLKPEMFARVSPIADEHSRLPRLPNTAIVTQGLYSYVFVEQGAGVLQRRKVQMGLQGHEYSFVKAGLKAGERAVTNGTLLLNAELAGND